MTSTRGVRSVFAVLPVTDLAEALEWYERFLGRSPDTRPMPSLADYHLRGGDDDAVERATLQLFEDPRRAGGGLATLNVADARAVREALAAEGITLELATTDAGLTFGTVDDPDGNRITVIQPPA